MKFHELKRQISARSDANNRPVTFDLVYARLYLHFWDGMTTERRERRYDCAVFYAALHYFLSASVLDSTATIKCLLITLHCKQLTM